MITYEFTINKFPEEITGPSSLAGFIEGDFSISVNEVEVFNEQEFLIYEFFDALHNWFITQDERCTNFYFVSMDYEEEPVIAYLCKEGSNDYYFDSAFKLSEASFSFKDIANSYKELMVDLREQLLVKYKYFLEL